jgi:hypothetical protein
VSLYVSLYVLCVSYAGLEASNAVLGNGQWEAKPDSGGLFWIGGRFAEPVRVIKASWEIFSRHEWPTLVLEYFDSDDDWQTAQVLFDASLTPSPSSPSPSSARHQFSKVLFIVSLRSNYTRALSCENVNLPQCPRGYRAAGSSCTWKFGQKTWTPPKPL